jgi:hypothetical protein
MEYFMVWTFGIARGNLVYFSCFGILYKEKSGNHVADIQLFDQGCQMFLGTTYQNLGK